MRVLVVRPSPAAARTAERLAALGHAALAAPLLAYEPTKNPCPAGSFDILLATSAQAFAALDAQGEAPEQLRALALYAVGARTHEAARRAGFRACVCVAPDADALAREIARLHPRGGAGAHALYLAGVDRKPHLEAALRAMGFTVSAWEVYAAKAAAALPAPAQEALAAGALDAALHYSRRSAEIFCALAQAAGLAPAAARLRHIAISPDAAAGLAALAPADLRVAGAPEEAAMLDLLSAP